MNWQKLGFIIEYRIPHFHATKTSLHGLHSILAPSVNRRHPIWNLFMGTILQFGQNCLIVWKQFWHFNEVIRS